MRVHAAGVDRGVWHVMTGLPYPIASRATGCARPRTPVLGMDVAGVVEAVGSDVTRFRPGDEVFGIGKGSFAEYAARSEDKLAPKPANLTFEQAAAVAISGLTALQGLRDHGKVRPGQKVLIIGASGGVGTYAVQLAKAFGAEVTGVCSTAKVDLVRSLGADHVIDYTREDFADGRAALRPDPRHRRERVAVTPAAGAHPEGTLVIVGGETGGRWLGGIDRQLRALLLSPFVGQKLRHVHLPENHEDLLVLKELIEAGKVTPVIDRTLPAERGPRGHPLPRARATPAARSSSPCEARRGARRAP